MTVQLRVWDETPAGRRVGELVVELPDTVTLRELIRHRVREEVARHNAQGGELFRGLVQPTDTEATLNGYKVKRGRRIDWERQADVALEAFGRNGFFVLVGDRQVEDLDETLQLSEASEVAFVRLVPLVGG